MYTTTVYLICFHPGIPRGPRPGNASHYLGFHRLPDPADRRTEYMRAGIAQALSDTGGPLPTSLDQADFAP